MHVQALSQPTPGSNDVMGDGGLGVQPGSIFQAAAQVIKEPSKFSLVLDFSACLVQTALLIWLPTWCNALISRPKHFL